MNSLQQKPSKKINKSNICMEKAFLTNKETEGMPRVEMQ